MPNNHTYADVVHDKLVQVSVETMHERIEDWLYCDKQEYNPPEAVRTVKFAELLTENGWTIVAFAFALRAYIQEYRTYCDNNSTRHPMEMVTRFNRTESLCHLYSLIINNAIVV